VARSPHIGHNTISNRAHKFMADPDFQQALAHHRQGRLGQAAALYQAILQSDPAHFDALHLLGVIEAQTGNPRLASDLIARAIAVDAGHAVAHFHHGLALQALGQADGALASFGRALALQSDFAEALNHRALALHTLGRHAEALESAERALALEPRHAEALFNRGVALQALRRHTEALQAYDQALEVEPGMAGALNNRALVLQMLGRHEEALASFERALAAEPGHAELLLSRAHALRDLQRRAEALAAYDQVLALQPGRADALAESAQLLLVLQRPDHALARLERLLALEPEHVQGLFWRGLAQHTLGRAQDALGSYDRALALQPDFAAALGNRGLVLQALGRAAEALASYERALAVQPGFAEALNNRGFALHVLGRHEEAIASYDRALAADPGLAQAWYSRGVMLQLLGRGEAALESFDRALALQPDLADALGSRADTLVSLQRFAPAAADYARLLQLVPDRAYALGNRLHAAMFICDWREHAALVQEVRAAVRAGQAADMPFSFLSVSDSPAEQLQCARIYVARVCPAAPAPLWNGEPYRHEKIRLAYVSADLREHAMSFLLAQLFETHDRRRFEPIAISLRPAEATATGQRVKAAFPQFIDVSASTDREIAELMRRLEVDIAVDLMGYTTSARRGVYALRPAPLQVNYLGYPGTLGAGYMDYIIADAHLIPAGSAAHYAEQVVTLPDSYQPRDCTALPGVPAGGRAGAGLPDRGFVFCCFNNAYKFNPPVFDIWMRLLQAVPGSVLWLFETNAEATASLREQARKRAVDPGRLVFAARMPMSSHIARLALADLFLDTLPYNAHTTASDALWAGLPVLTCMGESFAGRVAGSLLAAAGLPELVTRNLADYEALALQLARSPALLLPLRARLLGERSSLPLFNAARYRRHLESAYAIMHQRAQQGLAPAGFAVPAID
jgi:predicted O-linked N-acetylglucosamine transferase (SPINDLY family)